MPHKHRARRGRDGTDHDLPPDQIARPLAVGKSKSPARGSSTSRAARKGKSSQREYKGDDTPKAFLRLMQFHKTGKTPQGLDNGDGPPRKKRKQADTSSAAASDHKPSDGLARPALKLQPGERLADFNARVDQALPVAGLAGKRRAVDGVRERQTKHEKKLRKLQAGWREEEVRIREREAEERELAEEREDEEAALYGDRVVGVGQGLDLGRKKGKRKRGHSGDGDDDDPWAQLAAARERPKGLHDVVQAPPTFQKLPKEKFKVYDGAKAHVADIPNAAGSLRRREELGQTRQDIIENYRRMMQEKRKA